MFSVRNHLLPRYTNMQERGLLATILSDLWPEVEVDFGLDDSEKSRGESMWNVDVNAEVCSVFLLVSSQYNHDRFF